MAVSRTAKLRTEPGEHRVLVWALTVIGSALFVQGLLRITTDPGSASMWLKLSGWFVTSGWFLQHLPGARQIAAARFRRLGQRLETVFALPGDGILEMLLFGLLFIVLLLLGMVSLWSGTIP